MPIPHLIVFGMARSGTTAVGQVIQKTAGCAWLGESFNAGKAWIPAQHLTEIIPELLASGTAPPGTNPDNLNEWTRKNPSRFLGMSTSTLERQGYKFMATKILWNQLPPGDLMKIFPFNDNGCNIVILRDPVATFISSKKALITGKWNRFDYTTLKPSLSVEDWHSWLKGRANFLSFLEKNIEMFSGVLSYEELAPAGALEPKRVKASFSEIFPIPIQGESGPAISKQDRQRTPRDRVGNWDELQAHFDNHGCLSNTLTTESEIRRMAASMVNPQSSANGNRHSTING